jgi:hypothetical protein
MHETPADFVMSCPHAHLALLPLLRCHGIRPFPSSDFKSTCTRFISSFSGSWICSLDSCDRARGSSRECMYYRPSGFVRTLLRVTNQAPRVRCQVSLPRYRFGPRHQYRCAQRTRALPKSGMRRTINATPFTACLGMETGCP